MVDNPLIIGTLFLGGGLAFIAGLAPHGPPPFSSRIFPHQVSSGKHQSNAKLPARKSSGSGAKTGESTH